MGGWFRRDNNVNSHVKVNNMIPEVPADYAHRSTDLIRSAPSSKPLGEIPMRLREDLHQTHVFFPLSYHTHHIPVLCRVGVIVVVWF